MCNSAVYYRDMIYMHDNIFLTDTIDYDQPKFGLVYIRPK